MVLFYLILSLLTCLFLYYLNGKYNENYWKKRGVVFYQHNKVLGPVWEFLRTDQALFKIFHEKLYKKFPNEPAIGIGSFINPSLYVIDPKNIQHVMQTDFHAFNHRGVDYHENDLLADNILFMNGIRWKLMRQGMSPLFTSNKMKDMFYVIDKSAKDLVNLVKNNPDGIENDTFETFNTFCSAAVGAAVFGIQTKSVFDSPFLDMAKKALAPTTIQNIKFSIASIMPQSLKLFRIIIFTEYVDFFIGAIKQVIRQREQENVKKHDFADLCVTLQKNGVLKDTDTGYELKPTDELLAAQAFFFYVAGVEPTATLLYCTFVELGRHPEILKKVHEEIDQVWEKYQGKLSFDALSEIEYLDKVMNETLRMYPPIGFLTRLCVRDSVLPVGNIKISKGTKIFTPVFELHHDPQFYPNPEVFDPERFAQDSKSNDITYQPFGKGGRLCIGMRYARLQAKTGIVHMLREFTPKTTVLEGGIKFSKQQVQVRPTNVEIKLVPRITKSKDE